MYQYKYEDVGWQRLKDLQREMENARALERSVRERLAAAWLLAQRVWLIAGRRPLPVEQETEEAKAAPHAA